MFKIRSNLNYEPALTSSSVQPYGFRNLVKDTFKSSEKMSKHGKPQFTTHHNPYDEEKAAKSEARALYFSTK